MFDISNVPGYALILGIPILFLRFYWPWVIGAIFLLVLWKLRKPIRIKFKIAAIAIGLFVIGKIIFHFFPGYIPGCNDNFNKVVYRMSDYNIINQKNDRYFFPYTIMVKRSMTQVSDQKRGRRTLRSLNHGSYQKKRTIENVFEK